MHGLTVRSVGMKNAQSGIVLKKYGFDKTSRLSPPSYR